MSEYSSNYGISLTNLQNNNCGYSVSAANDALGKNFSAMVGGDGDEFLTLQEIAQLTGNASLFENGGTITEEQLSALMNDFCSLSKLYSKGDAEVLMALMQDYQDGTYKEDVAASNGSNSSTGSTGSTDGSGSTTGSSNANSSSGTDGASGSDKDGSKDGGSAGTTSLNKAELSAIVTKLYAATKGQWGTDEDAVRSILLSEKYSPADILAIMDAYEKEYPDSLMQVIQDEFSFGQETELREALYGAAKKEALSALGWKSTADIPEDIAKLAGEFYKELKSMSALGYMSGTFSKLSDKQKAQVMLAVELLYDQSSALSMITEGRVWFGAEDGYVRDIIDALRNTAKSKS